MATRYRTITSTREAFRSDVPKTSYRRNDQTSSSDVSKTSSGVHGSTSSRRPNKTSLGPVHDDVTSSSRRRISCRDGTKWFILYNENVESKRQSVESKMGSLALWTYFESKNLVSFWGTLFRISPTGFISDPLHGLRPRTPRKLNSVPQTSFFGRKKILKLYTLVYCSSSRHQ